MTLAILAFILTFAILCAAWCGTPDDPPDPIDDGCTKGGTP